MTATLCLDFDGVLCDSMDECLVVAYHAFFGRQIASPLEVPDALRHFFYRYRYLVAPADDFYLLLQAFERGLPELDRTLLRQLGESAGTGPAAFALRFFACRELQRAERAHWLGLHRRYRQSRAVLRREFPDFYVLTTKDRESVELLAAHHGYRHKVAGIYGKEISTDKRVSLQALCADQKLDPRRQRVLLVDDNHFHLARVRPLAVETYLAGWGYGDPLETGGFPVLHDLNELSL